MHIFLEKNCKIAASSGALSLNPLGFRRLGAEPPDPPALFSIQKISITFSEFFRFPGRGSILLLPSRWVDICLSWLHSFQGSPRGGCRHNPTSGSRWWDCGLAQKNCTQHLVKRSAQTKKKNTPFSAGFNSC